MINYNLHQHTFFSDGKGTPMEFAEKAIELGLSTIGFSEHSPLPFSNPFSLQDENIDNYISAVEEVRENFKDQLAVYRSLEMDYIPGISEDFNYWRDRCKVDYLIGSVHLVAPDGFDELWFTDGPDYKIYDEGVQRFFDGDIKRAVRQFYQQTNAMIETQQFEIIGHFDKIKMHNRDRFFTDEEKWYRDLINETIDLIKQKNLIVEINTRGIYKKRSKYLFPDGYALEKVKDSNIPILLSSDAHHKDELIMLFDETQKRLTDMGFRSVIFFENGNWGERNLSKVT